MKRILTLFLILSFVISSVAAQDDNSGFTVSSNPSGAFVELKGEAKVTGITPTSFRFPLVGEYSVLIKRHGYESYKSRILLDPSKPLTLDVTLARKTRLKAAARSLFIPGWGQKYSDQNGKAILFGILTVAAATSYLILDNDFDSKFDEFELSRQRFDDLSAGGATNQELQFALAELKSKQDIAYDAETDRRYSIGAIVAVWGLSILDALFLTPEERGTFTVNGISLDPSLSGNSVGVTLTRAF